MKVNPRVISDSVREEASASRFEVQDRRNKKRINETDFDEKLKCHGYMGGWDFVHFLYSLI